MLSYYYKGSPSWYSWWLDDWFRPKSTKTIFLEREIKARRVKGIEFKGYNSKIVSAGKDWREEVLKLDQFYLGFRPTVDTALIPLCNTRFIKEHKPSNHIRARIKSHVYTTEWTVYHSTYHVKRHNKANTNVFITLMTKMSNTAEAKFKYDKSSPKLNRAPQGRRLGDERLEVLVVLVALSELSSSRVSKRKK